MTQLLIRHPEYSADAESISATDYVRAVVNILEDIGDEKQRLETTQKAVLNILEDLEDEKRSAQEANRMKSEFLANMSHELRTPLNSIIGFSELMSDGKVGKIAENHKEYLGDILTSARHLLQLINDVLDLAKVEAGKLDFDAKPIEISQLIHGIRDTLRSIAASRNIKVDVEISSDLSQITGDPSRLKQVLYNYLSNALKFTPNGGYVLIGAEKEGNEHFRISVRDTGDGIAPHQLSRLFVEFEQLDSSIAKRHQGTGLGLALTKRIVEAQGGYVGVESKVNVGSNFFAVLPITLRPENLEWQEKKEAKNSSIFKAPSVLVLQDSTSVRNSYVEGLLASGYRAVGAQLNSNALKLVSEKHWDAIVLSSLCLNDFSTELLAQIRSDPRNTHTPVIVGGGEGLNLSTVFGLQEILPLPVSKDDLKNTLIRAEKLALNNAHVMLVGERNPCLIDVEAFLRELGYHALLIESPNEAIAEIRRESPDAILLDFSMCEHRATLFLEQFLGCEGCHRTIPIIALAPACQEEKPSQPELIEQQKETSSCERLIDALFQYVPIE